MDTFNYIFESSLLVLSLVTKETDAIWSLLLCTVCLWLPRDVRVCVCVSTSTLDVHMWLEGFSHTHIQERKYQMFHFLCVWVRVCCWGERQCRPADSAKVCNTDEILACSVFCQNPLLTTFQTNTVLPPTTCLTSVKALLQPIEQVPYHYIQVECPADLQD